MHFLLMISKISRYYLIQTFIPGHKITVCFGLHFVCVCRNFIQFFANNLKDTYIVMTSLNSNLILQYFHIAVWIKFFLLTIKVHPSPLPLKSQGKVCPSRVCSRLSRTSDCVYISWSNSSAKPILLDISLISSLIEFSILKILPGGLEHGTTKPLFT